MQTLLLPCNRVRRFFNSPMTGFWQPPVDERHLWFLLGILTGQAGFMAVMLMRAVRVFP